jgi:hypothetical protein
MVSGLGFMGHPRFNYEPSCPSSTALARLSVTNGTLGTRSSSPAEIRLDRNIPTRNSRNP